MILIDGINHIRLTGIWDEPGGGAEDFDPENCGGYRSPQTPQERAACIAKALEYYNACSPSVRTGPFGIITITREQAELLGDASAAASLMQFDIEAEFLEHAKSCKFCEQLFLPDSLRQDICKRPECQRRRRAEKMAAYRKRKKNNPSQDPA